jgi:hypothetical protein
MRFKQFERLKRIEFQHDGHNNFSIVLHHVYDDWNKPHFDRNGFSFSGHGDSNIL